MHVEVEPFGTSRPGPDGPKAQLGSAVEGAFVEFDQPPGVMRTDVGPRQTGVIPVEQPLSLVGLNPQYIKVRRSPWEFWRRNPER